MNLENAIGEYVTANGVEFQVVGIFGPDQIKPWTEADLEATVIPLSTMDRAFGTGGRIHYFALSALPGFKISDIEDEVYSILKTRHHVARAGPRGLLGFNLEEQFEKITGLFTGINIVLWIVSIGILLSGIVADSS